MIHDMVLLPHDRKEPYEHHRRRPHSPSTRRHRPAPEACPDAGAGFRARAGQARLAQVRAVGMARAARAWLPPLRERGSSAGEPAREAIATGAPEPARRSERRRWIALAVLCLGQLMMVLDATIVNVALPSIQRDLHFSQGNLTWVLNGYLITFGGFLLLAGRFGDLVGRKKVFLTGLVMFSAASVLCGVASSQGMLIAARLLQGVGGAVASSVILAIIVTEFPARAE